MATKAIKEIFTTGDVAKLLKVAPRTISKWVDTGKLRGYRIPGSRFRRVPRANLIRFLAENQMPTIEEFSGAVSSSTVGG